MVGLGGITGVPRMVQGTAPSRGTRRGHQRYATLREHREDALHTVTRRNGFGKRCRHPRAHHVATPPLGSTNQLRFVMPSRPEACEITEVTVSPPARQ